MYLFLEIGGAQQNTCEMRKEGGVLKVKGTSMTGNQEEELCMWVPKTMNV